MRIGSHCVPQSAGDGERRPVRVEALPRLVERVVQRPAAAGCAVARCLTGDPKSIREAGASLLRTTTYDPRTTAVIARKGNNGAASRVSLEHQYCPE